MSFLRACTAALLVMLATACTSSASAPSDPPTIPATVSGTWSGRYEVINCTTDAPDARGCAHNRIGGVTLVLTQTGADVTGSVTFRSDQTGALVVSSANQGPLPVKGRFESTRLSLAGSDTLQISDSTIKWVLEDWRTETSAPREMEGTTVWSHIQMQASRTPTTYTFRRVYRLTGIRRAVFPWQ